MVWLSQTGQAMTTEPTEMVIADFDIDNGARLAAAFSDGTSADTYVWVVDEQTRKLSRRQVDARRFARSGLSVQSGLSAGEWVVVAGAHSVTEGLEVRIFDVESGQEVAR